MGAVEAAARPEYVAFETRGAVGGPSRSQRGCPAVISCATISKGNDMPSQRTLSPGSPAIGLIALMLMPCSGLALDRAIPSAPVSLLGIPPGPRPFPIKVSAYLIDLEHSNRSEKAAAMRRRARWFFPLSYGILCGAALVLFILR